MIGVLQTTSILGVAFVVAWGITRAVIPLLQSRGVVDVPNERSSHSIPTPRGGGIGIAAGIVAGMLLAWLTGFQVPGFEVLLGGLIIAAVGFMDDRKGGLPVSVRLTAQLIASGLVVYRAGGIERLPFPEPLDFSLGFLSVPLTIVWIVGVLNIYNFLDGIDGFAGLQGVVAGLGFALWAQGDSFAVGVALAGACGGFLWYNWHPARVFMGDVGSGTIGFVLAVLPLQLTPARRSEAVFVVAMCLWFFLSDGVFTILRRLSHGEPIWKPHRSHLYQRLVKTGVGHDRVTINVIGAAALLAGLVVGAARTGNSSSAWGVVIFALIGFAGYYAWTWLRERPSGGAGISAAPRDQQT